MSKGTRTREAILDAALEFASLAGFQGLALQPLADRVGLTKSGLYAHFRSKEALELATLVHATVRFRSAVVAPAKSAPPGLPRLSAIYDAWLAWPANVGLSGQCPFFSAAVEFDDRDGAMRRELFRLFRDFRDVIEQLAASALRHGHLPAETDPAQFAHEFMALRYAHHWSSGFMRDPEALRRARAGFERLTGTAPVGSIERSAVA
jgi:AcrR family transcriptional regulator